MAFGLFCEKLAAGGEQLLDMPATRRDAAVKTAMSLSGGFTVSELLGTGAARPIGADGLDVIAEAFRLLASEMREEEAVKSK